MGMVIADDFPAGLSGILFQEQEITGRNIVTKGCPFLFDIFQSSGFFHGSGSFQLAEQSAATFARIIIQGVLINSFQDVMRNNYYGVLNG